MTQCLRPVDAFFRKYDDFNRNRTVNLLDFAEFRSSFGFSAGDSKFQQARDADGDDLIGLLDFAAFHRDFGT